MTAGCWQCEIAAVGENQIEQLIATRDSLKRAMLNGDAETLELTYSDDYELVTRKGVVRTRSERVDMIEAGKLRYVNLGEESDVSVRVYGNVAVVRGAVGTSQTSYAGEKREPRPRRFTEIWTYENGRWQAVGRQATVIADTETFGKIVGTWALESIEGRDESGNWIPLQDRFGADPVGYINYDSTGHMAVQIMRRNRPLFSAEDRRDVPSEEAKSALLGFTAYFGTFSIDEDEQSVTHHRVGHVVPNLQNVDVKRFYHFYDDQMTLTLPDGNRRLTWSRLR